VAGTGAGSTAQPYGYAGSIVADRPAPRFTATLLKEEGQWRLVSLRLADGVGALAPAGIAGLTPGREDAHAAGTGRAPVR
jgi:hypothetical protein